MVSEVEKVPVLRLTETGKSSADDVVVREFSLTIVLNNQELVTLLCSPKNLDYLAVGFLSSEGLLKGKDDIKKIMVDDRLGVVRVETEAENKQAGELLFKRLITSGCGRGASFYSPADVGRQVKVESQVRISAPEILELAKEFQHHSEIYRATH